MKQGRKKLSILAMVVAAGLSLIGCGSSKNYRMPIEHNFSAGAGVLLPGRSQQQDMPNITVGEFDYRAKLNENWSAGMAFKFGKGSESSSGNPSANEPAYSTAMDTQVINPYVQWQKQFGNRHLKEVSIRGGLSFGKQNLRTTVGDPINDNFHIAEETQGVSVGTRYQRWNQKRDASFYTKVDVNLTNGENISNSVTTTMGVEFKLE